MPLIFRGCLFFPKIDFSYRDGHFIDDGCRSEKARKLNQGKERRSLSFGFS